jgi:hypothetical protein
MWTLRLGALAVLLTVVGCSSSAVCEALVQGTHDEDARGAPCGVRSLVIDYRDCPDWLRGCTASDQRKIQAYAECLSRLPTCSPGMEEDWNDQRGACAVVFANLSPSCPS